MSHAERFAQDLFTELTFDARHLAPLKRLYRQMGAGELGEGVTFRASPGLHANMTWHYATSPRALDAFRRCIESSQLRQCLSIVRGDAQLLAACFVVVQGDTPALDFHMDYGEREIPSGVTGTMLTPLLPLDEVHGHLEWCEDESEFEYRYRVGEALLFDGKFEHRSQASAARGTAARVLVSWSIATSDARYRLAIGRIIDSQTK